MEKHIKHKALEQKHRPLDPTQTVGGETYPTQSVGGETYNSLSQSNFRDMIFSWHKAPRHPQHDLINKIDPSIKGFENGSYDKSVASLGTNFPVPLGIFLNSQDACPRFYRQKKAANECGTNTHTTSNSKDSTTQDNTQLSQATLYDKYLSAHSTQFDGYDHSRGGNSVSQLAYEGTMSQHFLSSKTSNDSYNFSFASQEKGYQPCVSSNHSNMPPISSKSQKSTEKCKSKEYGNKFDPNSQEDFPELDSKKIPSNISSISHENHSLSMIEAKSDGFVPFRKTIKMRKGLTDS